jgi:hypothetical protein
VKGYGRGYYGDAQLAQRSGGGWFKIAAIVGLGAVTWYWVLPKIRSRRAIAEISQLPPLPPSPSELEQIAQMRGYASAREYEDAIVAMARDLAASGAKVDLGAHFQHLRPYLEQP